MEFIVEVIFSGFVSKVVNDIVDISKDKIKEAVKNKNTKYQSIESQIYNIIIDVLNKITYNKYYDQDILFDVAEKILVGFQDSNNDVLDVVRIDLHNIVDLVDNDKCEEFIKLVCEELSRKDYEELYHYIRLRQEEKESRKTSRIEKNVNKIDSKLEQRFNEINKKLDSKNKVIEPEPILETMFSNNKKEDYIKNWNSRLFLHQNNDERMITLADAFIMPDYNMYLSNFNIKISEDDTLEQAIESFINYNRTSTMLITGVPGMGKSSITSWIANKYKDDDRVIILRFRDWQYEEVKKGLLNATYNTLECKKKDLEGKILVYDGFDEIKALDIRNSLLNDFFTDIKDFDNFKCIITSRPAYVNAKFYMNILELIEFDIDKVEKFYEKITRKKLDGKENIKSNLKVLGIPVILYMAIMCDVDVSENPTKPELYNRIFAEEGGIFDRFFDGVNQYSPGTQIMRNPENIKKYLEFLREIAFKMFEKNSLVLLKDEYEIPKLPYQGDSLSVLEFPIKHIFENTSAKLEFIHKSIYEYFVSEYIYNSIADELNNKDEEIRIELAGVLGSLLKKNELTPEILEFLKYKIRSSELDEEFDVVYEAFQVMLRDGMTYHINKCYKNVIDLEMMIFVNMLEILHLWEKDHYIFNEMIVDYIKYNYKYALNLNDVDLRRADLRKANLRGARLREACLEETNLREACLEEANLKRANLKGANLVKTKLERADLRETDLREAHLGGVNLWQSYLYKVVLNNTDLRSANLREACLEKADLRKANLIEASLKGADLGGAVFDEKQIEYLKRDYNLEDTNVFIRSSLDIISFKEYCKRKQ